MENLNFNQVFAYKIKNSIYINTTTYCSNVCNFCIKFFDVGVYGYDLRIDHDPSVSEVSQQIDAILSPEIDSIVFCGLGESTYRLDFMEEVALKYKAKGLKIRLNTNGHGNWINGYDITPRLAKFIDIISISLNAHDAKTYDELCNPAFENAFDEVIDFTKKCVGKINEIYLTVVDLPCVDIKKCQEIADSLNVKLRIRPYIEPKKQVQCDKCCECSK